MPRRLKEEIRYTSELLQFLKRYILAVHQTKFLIIIFTCYLKAQYPIYKSEAVVLEMRVPGTFHFYGYIGPLECIFIALLALFNEGVRAHFFHLMEAPTMRLQNAKILLCLPSR